MGRPLKKWKAETCLACLPNIFFRSWRRFLTSAAVSTNSIVHALSRGLVALTSFAVVPQTGATCWSRYFCRAEISEAKSTPRSTVAPLMQAMVGMLPLTTTIHRHQGPPRAAASLRLDVGCPDHVAPLVGFIGEQLAEVG